MKTLAAARLGQVDHAVPVQISADDVRNSRRLRRMGTTLCGRLATLYPRVFDPTLNAACVTCKRAAALISDEPARCECCDLPVESCGKAAERRADAELAQRRARLFTDPRWFPAQWAGTCVVCGERFDERDPITAPVRGGGWVAGLCCADKDTS